MRKSFMIILLIQNAFCFNFGAQKPLLNGLKITKFRLVLVETLPCRSGFLQDGSRNSQHHLKMAPEPPPGHPKPVQEALKQRKFHAGPDCSTVCTEFTPSIWKFHDCQCSANRLCSVSDWSRFITRCSQLSVDCLAWPASVKFSICM